MISREIKMVVPNQQMNNHLTNNSTNNEDNNECTIREQDRFMPIANVIRIMRRILPPHAKISDDAKETIQECVSEFISFITGEANERCQHEQRKTITAEDVLWAMSKLGFDDYVEPLTLHLHRYREFDSGDRGSMRSSEPLVKRTVSNQSNGAMGFAGYGPAFHMGNHHGFFGTGNMAAGMLRDAQGAAAGSSGAALTSLESLYGRCKE